MIFAVLFQDNPGREHLRQQNMPAHLDFLAANPAITAAGPLLDSDGTGHGGLWLVDAPDIATATALTRTDPFHDTGLRKTITVLEWRQVFRDGERLI